MAKQIFQKTINDEDGNVVPNAELEIRYEGNGQLALTWTDRAGDNTGANPVQADSNGFVQVYLDPNRYKMTPSASGQGVGEPWRDVLILPEELVDFGVAYSAESTTLFREPPVTAGTSSAYTVAGWSGIQLVDNRVYTARMHTNNAAGATLEELDIVNLDDSAIQANQLIENGVYKFLYVGGSPATFRVLDIASNKNLSAIGNLASAADKLPYFTGAGTAGVTNLTVAGRALIDDPSAAAQRTTLGLHFRGAMTNNNSGQTFTSTESEITFNIEIADTDNIVDLGSSNTDFVIPAALNNWYCRCAIKFNCTAAPSADTTLQFNILEDSNTTESRTVFLPSAAAAIFDQVEFALHAFNTGDEISFSVDVLAGDASVELSTIEAKLQFFAP